MILRIVGVVLVREQSRIAPTALKDRQLPTTLSVIPYDIW